MSNKKYSNNNLSEVIFQIRFMPLLDLYTDDKEAVKDFQNIVNVEFPDVIFQRENKTSTKIDSEGRLVESKNNDEFLTWIFSNKNNKKVEINSKQLTLNYSGNNYINFDNFLKDINLVLKGLNQYNIVKIKHIELRYINQIKIKNYSLLHEYINPNLDTINKEFNNNLIQSINKTELKIDDYKLTFQFGEFNPEYPNVSTKKDFILDYDCILEDDEEFNNIPLNLVKMHNIILDRFENDIGDKLREEMM